MNNLPKPIDLTIVVPVSCMSGRLKNLCSWLDSVNRFNVEVILVHDIQDQETAQELAQLKSAFPSEKIRMLEGKFGNPGGARNLGKKNARGNYITFCDSDDVLHLERVMESLTRHPGYDVLLGKFSVIDSMSQNTLFVPTEPKTILNLAKNPGLWRFVFRTEILEGIDFIQSSMAEDQLFLADVRIFEHKLKKVDAVFYDYFINCSSQLTSNKSKLTDIYEVLARLARLQEAAKGRDKTFAQLLILKNFVTLAKNLNVSFSKDKSVSSIKLMFSAAKFLLLINWFQALAPWKTIYED